MKNKELIKHYQSANTRNSKRAGRAMGKICFLKEQVYGLDLTDSEKSSLYIDLTYVYNKLNEIEL
jgi:hypothetical protein|tara:strand:+ start:14 stop:208 length:195 start_codon:yes stop_codon:yes gene_type:complete